MRKGPLVQLGRTERTTRRGSGGKSRSFLVASAVLAGALAISGCTIGEGGEAESPVAEAPAEPAAQIDASVEDGSSDANPAEPVVLTASEGEF